MLSETERSFLLEAARNAITSAVLRIPAVAATPPSPVFMELRGAFVSLHEEGELRGCIGYIDPIRPLLATVTQAARMAATEDTRFQPVRALELPLLQIEISVLSVPEVIHAPEEIEIGTHGILLESGRRRGLLLPQVAAEYGWDQTTFLNHTAQKAGLPKHAWQLSGVTLYRFTAEIFHEPAPSVHHR